MSRPDHAPSHQKNQNRLRTSHSRSDSEREQEAARAPRIDSLRRNVSVARLAMAGIYARTDVERGVHKALASVVIRAIDCIHRDVTKREQAQRRYINVRGLFLFVEEWIEEGTHWVVFEPATSRCGRG